VRRGDVFPIVPLTGMLAMAGARSHLVPVAGLRRLVLRHIPCDRLEDLPTPLHVVACDLRSGGEVRLSEGPLVDALLASAAIPGVFPPVAWGDRLLIDGGVIDNTPTSHALDLGADEIYVLSSGGPGEPSAAPRGGRRPAVRGLRVSAPRRVRRRAPAGRARCRAAGRSPWRGRPGA
jgi:NTE family protein